MRSGRAVLTLAVIASLPFVAGCPIGLGVTAGTGGYIATGEQTTKDLTYLASMKPADDVENAVKVWMDRGQLPLPVLPGDGMHNFATRKGDLVRERNAKGAQVVELYESGRLIAEYVVAWNREPAEYRLTRAVNRLYDAKLDVLGVPALRLQDLNLLD